MRLAWNANARRAGVLTLLAMASGMTACTGAQFGSEIGARPKLHLIRAVERTTLHLPKDEPFSIALPSVSRKAGFDGVVEGDATAKPTGEAEATATVRTAGTVESLFQLGHGLANDTDRQMDFDIKVRFQYEFIVTNEPAAPVPDATVGLRLYVRDDRGRLLRDMVQVDYSTESGAAHQAADKSVDFTVTLGPGGWINVFLAGLAKVDLAADRSASATLKFRDLQMEVATQAAPELPGPTR